MQRELLDQLKAQLLDIRGVLDEKISAIEEDERTNLQRLAEVTGRMEPESAAQVLAEMEKERAAKILYLVNERRAAGIMDAAVAMGDQGVELAAEWADIIRRLKKNNDK
jgi:flagellar motility protein MotE (MotC chaperone)